MDNKVKIFFSLIVGMAVGACAVYFPNRRKIELAENFDIFFQCEDFLKEKNLQPKEFQKDDYSVLNSMLSARYDKYTVYHNTERGTKEFSINKVNTTPASMTTGFELDFDKNDNLYFSKVIPDSEAEKQGIKKGDIILSADGKTFESDGYEFAEQFTGKEKTMHLILERKGEQFEKEFVLKSDKNISLKSAYSKMYGDTLYIAVYKVDDYSDDSVKKILSENKNFKSLIIDLRHNTGGNVESGLKIADSFISSGEVCEHFNNGDTNVQSIGNSSEDISVPMAVLADEMTASAGEMLTAIFKAYGNADIVGENTYGKGVFQTKAVIGRGMLNYTTGYMTVGDIDYRDTGIAPDIEIDMDYDEKIIGTDEDIQLQKALELLN